MVWCTRRRLVLQLEYIFENTQALLVYFSVSAVRGNFGSAALPAGLMKSNAEIEVGFRSWMYLNQACINQRETAPI